MVAEKPANSASGVVVVYPRGFLGQPRYAAWTSAALRHQEFKERLLCQAILAGACALLTLWLSRSNIVAATPEAFPAKTPSVLRVGGAPLALVLSLVSTPYRWIFVRHD